MTIVRPSVIAITTTGQTLRYEWLGFQQFVPDARLQSGHRDFELYLVDSEGEKEPVRVTETEGFDGLPVFHPNGKQLAWTSNRTAGKQSQIFLADWDHEAALELLGISASESASRS